MKRIDREYALVLAGGGTKGAYQVGIWRALKEIGIKVKAITGASIGAINGALILQDDIDKMIEIYENIEITDIMEISDKVNPNKNLFDLSNLRQLLIEYVQNKGLENTPLRKTLEKNVDLDKIYNSEIDFGMISYSFKTKEPLELFKKDISREEMYDYILASSCFPIFKSQKVGGKELVDGGFYDNAPVNMLIEKGYKNIIIANIDGLGFNKRTQDRNIHLKLLSPSEDLGGIFNFNHERMSRNIILGYLDTMKAFNKMAGNYYYFPKEEFYKLLDEFNLQTIRGFEMAAKIYKMDKYKPYDAEEFLSELYERHEETKQEYEKTKKTLKDKKIFNALEDIQNNDFALCVATALYLDQPTAKKLKIIQPYIEAVEALLELEDYME